MVQVSFVGCTIEAPILTASDDEKRTRHHLHQVEDGDDLVGRLGDKIIFYLDTSSELSYSQALCHVKFVNSYAI